MISLLLAVIYLAFIGLGLPDSLLGAAWPAMYGDFEVPIAYAGIVSVIISGGTIVSSLFSDRLTKKLTAKYVVCFSVLATAVALFGFSISKEYWQICLWAIPYGLGAGAIDAALNNYVALHFSAQHMNWLHCFWGVGTMIGPYAMSFALSYHGWQSGYRIVSFIQFGITAVLFLSLPLWRMRKNESGPQPEEKNQSVGLLRTLKIRGVPATLGGFFCYCAMECTCMLWSASYLVGTRGVSEERAAAFCSLYFIGVTVGRLISGFVAEKIGDTGMIRIGTGIATLGILLLSISAFPLGISLAGLAILGLGCAPIYPAVIHATPKKFGAEHSQTVIGLQMAAGYTGTLIAPVLFGWIASGIGLWFMVVFLALLAICMILLLEISNRKANKDKKTD
ncbi:MAG: MFS transporter [Ruminococcaceae bacterium]|nr:MFS transporter [Oscillospiraceae bacterium]